MSGEINPSILNELLQQKPTIPGLEFEVFSSPGCFSSGGTSYNLIPRSIIDVLCKSIESKVKSGEINPNNLRQIQQAIIKEARILANGVFTAWNDKMVEMGPDKIKQIEDQVRALRRAGKSMEEVMNEIGNKIGKDGRDYMLLRSRLPQLGELTHAGKGSGFLERVLAPPFSPAQSRNKDILKVVAQTVQRMITKKESADTAAKVAPAAGALALFRFLSTIPLSEAAATIGIGNVAALGTANFVLTYAGTRFILENTKTGKKIDAAVTDAMAKMFWNKFYEAKNKSK